MEWNQFLLAKVQIDQLVRMLTIVNRSKFEAVLESIVQFATDTSDASVEKIAFGVLNKMVVVWSTAAGTAHEEVALSNGFKHAFEEFVIEHLSRVCFEVPSKSTFNSNDAQSRLVSSLIPSLTI
jgi:exportin-T